MKVQVSHDNERKGFDGVLVDKTALFFKEQQLLSRFSMMAAGGKLQRCAWVTLDELLIIITAIVNASTDSSCVPRALQCAQIRPLLKKPTLDPDILKHYRPVSNLPFIAKVLEKVEYIRIERHLVSNGLHEELLP